MIYIPWIVFGFAILYMIYQANKTRTAYLRSKKELEKSQSELLALEADLALHQLKKQMRGQNQKQDPAEALVGSQQGQRPN
jgi:hypothetical protein